jgi:hypothetical protein
MKLRKSQLRQLIREEINNLKNTTSLNFIKTDGDGDEYLDIDKMEEVLLQNFESFESSMNLDEFEQYVDAYVMSASHDVGPDVEAYGSVPLNELLEDFKLFVIHVDLDEI